MKKSNVILFESDNRLFTSCVKGFASWRIGVDGI